MTDPKTPPAPTPRTERAKQAIYHKIIARHLDDLTDWMTGRVHPDLAAIVLRTWIYISENRDNENVSETVIQAEVSLLLKEKFPNGLPD